MKRLKANNPCVSVSKETVHLLLLYHCLHWINANRSINSSSCQNLNQISSIEFLGNCCVLISFGIFEYLYPSRLISFDLSCSQRIRSCDPFSWSFHSNYDANEHYLMFKGSQCVLSRKKLTSSQQLCICSKFHRTLTKASNAWFTHHCFCRFVSRKDTEKDKDMKSTIQLHS